MLEIWTDNVDAIDKIEEITYIAKAIINPGSGVLDGVCFVCYDHIRSGTH